MLACGCAADTGHIAAKLALTGRWRTLLAGMDHSRSSFSSASARERFTLSQARRIALAAQGFGDARPATSPTARHVARTLERLGLVQIDSVNVLVRAHYMPLFSRLGAYDPASSTRRPTTGARRRVFEYWGHEASLIRLDLQPLFRWRMERAARGEGIYGGRARFGRERPDFIDEVRAARCGSAARSAPAN